MKRSLGNSESLGALMSICPTTDEESPRNNHIYSKDFESMLDGLDEEAGHVSEKKRRLSVDQVKALEKNFEVENKLEPQTKVKLAQQLGLQPRQVAVWFQNRRARWKTKQLERDYGILITSYETLKLNFDTIKHDNESLLEEIRELKAKVNGESKGSSLSVKQEVIVTETESDDRSMDQNENIPVDELNQERFKNGGTEAILLPELKDGSSDSDSTAILNEDDNNNIKGAVFSYGVLQSQHLLMSPTTNSSSSSPSSMNCFQFSKTSYQQPYQYVKMEEHNLFSADEACSFFSDEQAPSLSWCYRQQWN